MLSSFVSSRAMSHSRAELAATGAGRGNQIESLGRFGAQQEYSEGLRPSTRRQPATSGAFKVMENLYSQAVLERSDKKSMNGNPTLALGSADG